MENKKLYTKWTWMLLLILFGWMGIAQAQEPVQEPVQAQTQEQVQAQEPALEQEQERERATTYDAWDGTQTAGTFALTHDVTLTDTVELTGRLELINTAGHAVTISRGNFDGPMFVVEGTSNSEDTLIITGYENSKVIIDSGAEIDPVDFTYNGVTYGRNTGRNLPDSGYAKAGRIIYLKKYSNLILEHVKLCNNYSDDKDGHHGGAIWASNKLGTENDGYYAPSHVGVFYMTDCEVYNCYARRHASVVNFPNLSRFSAILNRVKVHHCESYGLWGPNDDTGNDAYGGTLRAFGGTYTNMRVYDCDIYKNWTGWSGAGICWAGPGENEDKGHLTVGQGTKIHNNWAEKRGAGIYCTSNEAKFYNMEVYNNHAEEDGGGIMIVNYSGPLYDFGGWGVNARLRKGVKVYNNSAARDGGGVYVLFRASEFTGYGPAAEQDNFTDNRAVFDTCQIYGNTASRGAGICVCDACPKQFYVLPSQAHDPDHSGWSIEYKRRVNFNDVKIYDNIASNSGGGIYIIRSNGGNDTPQFDPYDEDNPWQDNPSVKVGDLTVTIKGSDTEIRDNTSGGHGGGIGINSVFKEDDHDGKLIVTIKDNLKIFDNVCEKNGGGLYLRYVDSCYLKNGYIGKHGANIAHGGNGGGIAIEGGDFDMAGGSIVNNVATRTGEKTGCGGGFYTYGGSDVTIKGGDIHNNTAAYGGGGYIGSGNVTLINHPEIYENTVSNNGGGLYVNKGNAIIEGGTIYKNTATNNGGGIYSRGGVTMKGGVIGGIDITDPNHPDTLANTAKNGGGFFVTSNEATHGSITFTASSTGHVSYNHATNDGGGFYVDNDGSVLMLKGTVDHNRADHDGGGFYIDDGDDASVVELRGTVTYNKAKHNGGGGYFKNHKVTLEEGLSFNHNVALNNGGGIFLNGNTLTYKNGDVSLNRAINGGGIYSDNSGTITITTGILGENTATNNGGGIYNNASTTNINGGTIGGVGTANTAINGGGIYQNSGTTNISGGFVSSNTASNYGGGVYINSGNLNMTGGTIGGSNYNYANLAVNGAGCYITNDVNAMVGGTVSHNQASNDGGGLYINEGSGSVSIRGTVDNNTAPHDGGGTYINHRAITLEGNANYLHNIASHYGGGLFVEAGRIDYSNGNVSQNEAIKGGGIYLNRVNGEGTVNFTAGTLSYNKALGNTTPGAEEDGDGGGIYSNYGPVIMNGTTSYNTAVNNGGGCYLNRGSISSTGTFSHNSATVNGGGLYVTEGDGAVALNGQFDNNTAVLGGGAYILSRDVTQNNCKYLKNIATMGGGLHLLGGSLNSVSGNFSNNQATAGHGGGLYAITTGSVTENGTVLNNTATGNGGGMYILDCDPLTLSGIIKNNQAYGTFSSAGETTGFGGGVYAVTTSNVSMDGTVDNNKAAADGGGMYILECNTLTVEGTVSNNHAYGTVGSEGETTGYGGGIYVIPDEDGEREVTLTGTLSYNTAAVDGGGLYTTGTDLVTVTGADDGGVIGNSAEVDGGGLFVTPNEGGQVRLSGTVRENTAQRNGGGAYTNGGTISYLAGKASRNHASNNGGAFYTYGGVTNMNDGVIVGGDLTCDGATYIEDGNTATNGGGIYIANAVVGDVTSGGRLNTGACSISSNMVTNKGGGIYVESAGSTDADNTVVHNNGALGGGGGIYHDGGTLTYTDGEVTDNKTAYTTLEECSLIVEEEDFESDELGDEWIVWTSGWQFGCQGNWWITEEDAHTGSHCVKGTSGYGVMDSNACLEITKEFPAGGVVSFFKKVYVIKDDLNSFGRSYLKFAVENAVTHEFTWLGSWSSNDTEWSQARYHFDAGKYIFRWYYWKNYPYCDDYALLDDIRFETEPVQELNVQWAEETTGGTSTTYAPANGGGIYMNNNGTTSITNGIITGNIASKDGGGIYQPGGDLSCTDNTVSSHNTAWNDGGGVYANHTNLTYTGGEVSFNRAGLLTYDEVSPESYNVDGFETGDFSAFNWQSSGASPWTISNEGASEGTYCVVADGIASGTDPNSTLTLTMNIPDNGGTISFYRKITEDPTAQDPTIWNPDPENPNPENPTPTVNPWDDNFILNFYIDDVETDHWTEGCGWGVTSYAVTGGTHVFKWTFGNKAPLNDTVEEDFGHAWIDNIKVGPITPAVYEYTWDLGSGGGVYAANGVADITECTITRNVASVNGGGLYLDNCDSPTQITGSLTRNSAFVYGGGLYANMGEVEVSGMVSHNTAVDGGGTYMNGGTITYNDCTITHNAASNNGGGLYTKGGETNINGSTINFQKAANGGGVYIADGGSLNTDDCNISDNQAFGNGENGGDGGGIYVEEGTTIAKTTILNSNEALNNGGGMYMDAGSLTFSDGSIQDNWTTVVESPESNLVENFDSGDFSANDWHVSGTWQIVNEHSGYCAKAGNLYNHTESSISVTADVPVATTISFFRKIKDFYTQYFYIDDVEMSQECIKKVIVLDWEQVTYPVLAGTHTFKWEGYGTGNFWIDDILLEVPLHEVYEGSEGNGAGLYANAGTVTLTGTEEPLLPVTQNTAMNNGGGIYTKNNTEVTVTYSNFENNKANGGRPNGGNGGGICMTSGSSGKLTAGQSNFHNNMAFAHGGGVYIEGGKTTMTECDVLENTGGEVIVSAGSNFANSHEGGLVYNDGRVVYFSEGDGGGIYQTGGSLTFTGGNVTDNRSVRDGGGIYAVGGATTTVEESNVENNMANGRFEFEEEYITDDFENENHDFSHLDWHTYSDDDDENYGLWIVKQKPDGEGYCAASGDIYDHVLTNNSYLTITMYYPMPGQVTFSRRFYGDNNGYVHAMFYIDGQQQYNLSGYAYQNWETVSINVPESGTHTFTWRFWHQSVSPTFGLPGNRYLIDDVHFTSVPAVDTTVIAQSHGGGIYHANGSLECSETVIEENSATGNGGGICTIGNTLVKATDASIEENTAGLNGGGVYSQENTTTTVTASDNSASSASRNIAALSGGGIYATGGNQVIVEASVDDNVANDGDGGGLYATNITTLVEMTNSTAERNTAKLNGGGIYVTNSGDVNVGATVDDNHANGGSGGGLYLVSNGDVTMTGTAEDNTAKDNGGGIYATSDDSMTVDATVDGNTANGGSGGGLYVLDVSTFVNMTGSASNNVAGTGSGGGIFVTNSGDVTVEADVDHNEANGGDGGGLYLVDNGSMEISGSASHNTASYSGGGIYATGDNSMALDANVDINWAKRGDGGGIYVDDIATVTMVGTANQNIANGKGGGAFLKKTEVTVSTGTEVNDNAATDNGGGIYLTGGSSTLSYTGSKINRNTAIHGGGAYIKSGMAHFKDGTELKSNTATSGNGGGINVEDGQLQLTKAHIDDNTALIATIPSMLNFAEDFETGDFSSYAWQTDGFIVAATPYANSNYGDWCAKTNIVTQPSTLSITLEFPVAGLIIFDYYTRTQHGGASISIDGVVADSWISTHTPWGTIGYEWRQKSVAISAGTHTLTWRYTPGEYDDPDWTCCMFDNIQYAATAIPGEMASNNLGKGGGIYLGGGTLVDCSRSTVNSNIASFDGGGIYTNVDMLAFSNDTVSSNTSMMGDGGGIHIIEGRQVNIVGGSVDNNTALTGRSGRGVRHSTRDEAIISESFETGDFSAFNWTTYGRLNGVQHFEESYLWTVVEGEANSGSYYAQSGPISANLGNSSDQSTDLILSIELPTPCILSFFRQVKCHIRYLSTYCDFYVDGYKQATFEGPVSSWGQYAYYPVSAGTHTFRWSFVRNRCDTDYTDDYARIDDIQFTPIVNPEVYPELAKKGNGGGLYVGNGSTVTYAGGVITENESVEGGGIFIDGSAIYLGKDESSTEHPFTEISNNMALGHGGGIYMRTGYLNYADGSVNHNTAVDGGGVYIQDGQGTVSNCNITYNDAVNGNPADNFFEGFERGNFSAYNWQFEGTTKWTVVNDEHHTGSYCAKSNANNSSSIILNTDILSDGVISFYVKGRRLRSFEFYIDDVQKFDGWDYEGNEWKQASFAVTAGNHTFKWHMGSENYYTWIDDIQFTANSGSAVAGKGGGLYAGGSSMVFEGCNFTNNTAKANGGGIYVHEKKELTLNGSTTVDSNTADIDGGGIYIPEQGVLTLHGATTVSNNHVLAEGHGGGIYQNGTLYLGGGTNPYLRCMDNFAGDEWQFDPEQGLNNRNNIYLPSHEKYVTVTSDVSGKTDGIHYDTRMGFTVYNSDAFEGGIPVVHVEDPDNEPWLYNLVSDISEDNGSVFDDESHLLAVHTRRNIDPYFSKQFIYLMGCWTTVVTRNPGEDHIRLIGDTYHIYTNRGLAWFSSLVNGLNRGSEANQNHFDGPQRGLNAVLEADVNMSRYLWVPLGAITDYNDNSSTFTEVDNEYYNASFNGQGHIISGLINTMLIKIRRFGLFGAVGGNAIVKNTLVDSYANASTSEDIYYMGGITGVAKNGAKIFNCEARGSSDIFDSKDLEDHGRKSYGGGIVGYLDNGVTLHSCMAMPSIGGKNSLIGGIAGNLPSSNSIKNCFVNGAFERNDDASLIGGLVGDNQGLVENCYVRMQAGSTEPDDFYWFGGANSGNFRFCYAPVGETNYGPGNISGHGNFGPTNLVSTKYGFAQQDQQVTKAPGQTNNYIVNGPIRGDGELTGLLPTLNNWVKDPAKGWDESQNMNDNGYSVWTRTMASTMNDDYPVLEFNDFVCISSKDGNFMSYGYDLNEKIDEYNNIEGGVTVLDQIDFEDGLFPAGWSNQYYPWEVSTTNPHSGRYCLSSSTSIPDSPSWPDYSNVYANVEFVAKGTISFYARKDGGNGNFSASGYGEAGDFDKSFEINSEEWTLYSFEVPAGRFFMQWSYATWQQGYGVIYIDDITYTQKAADEFSVFDFEDGRVPATWSNDASHPWVVMSMNNYDESYAYEGMYCIASGNNTDSDQGTTSSISATVTYTQDGHLSFYGRAYGYNNDEAYFYIDGVLMEHIDPNSGGGSWKQYVYEIPAGEHIVTWQYEKVDDETLEDYRFFIDKVVFSEPMRDRKIAYLYKTNPTVINTDTDEGVRVYVHPDVSVLQAEGNILNARVGVALDNSSIGFMSSDWHLFSSALKDAPTGLKYARIAIGDVDSYEASSLSDPDYQGDYWIANHYCEGGSYTPSGGYYDNGIPHDVFTTVQKMAPPKTRWKPTIGQFGYFPTDTPYGPWRGQTPQQAYDAGEEIHVGFFDFYTWDEPSYHWINLKREGFDYYFHEGTKSNRWTSVDHYPDHWHEDATEDGHHLRIDYTNETEMVPGKGYMMSISKPSMLMTDGVLNNDEISIDLTAVAQKPIIGGSGEDCMGESKSILTTTVTFEETGSVGFWCRVSTLETWGYYFYNTGKLSMEDEDGHSFYVTDDNMHAYNESEGGEIFYDHPSEWRYHHIDNIPPGTYTLEWTYQRNSNTSEGEDRYYIDDITFTGVSGGPVTVDFENGIPSGWLTGVDIINLEYVQEYGYESVEAYLLDYWEVSSLEELQETFGYWYSFVPWDRNVHGDSYCLASTNSYHECSGGGSGGSSSGEWYVMNEEYVEAYRGANLIGNPYQSYLDFDAFAEENGINAYYVFDADKRGFIAHVQGGSTPVTTGNYNVSHQQFGANGSSGGEQIVGDEVVDYSASQYLHPHQGFFVRVEDNKNAKFTNDMRLQDVESAFRSEENHYPMVNLICSDTAGRNEFATVEVGRPDKGGGRKIKGLHMGDASLWIRFDDKDWHVAFTPLGTKSVPVRFKAYTDGIFTMRWQAANTNFSYLHLIDNITGVDIDCLAEEQYIFEGKTSDYLSRFKLVFDFENNEAPEVPEEPEEPENPEPAEELTIFAFQMGDQLIVNGEGMLQMFDVQGRCLLQENMVGAQSAVSLPKVANGVYVLRLTCTNKVKTQKIVINKFK